MSEEEVHVTFRVPRGGRDRFLNWLQSMEAGREFDAGVPLGWRADDFVQRREALTKFVDRMETVLRQHDHKTTWRTRPIEALVRLMALEWQEFQVAFDLLEVSEARKECVDIANYAMIVDDRLSLLEQDKTMRGQT